MYEVWINQHYGQRLWINIEIHTLTMAETTKEHNLTDLQIVNLVIMQHLTTQKILH